MEELMKLADESPFNNVLRFEHHVLNPLLTPTKEHQHDLGVAGSMIDNFILKQIR